MTCVRASLVLSAVALVASATSVPAFAAEDFYKGKTISLYVSGGGNYEAYARLFAKYMPKYVPGEPTIVVKSMQGASGLKATNYIYNVAPKDGTEIAGTHGQIPLQQLFNTDGVQYDANKLSWIGSATKEYYVNYMWHTSPVQSLEDARVKESIVGGQALGSMSVDVAVLSNEMVGTKYKIVTGYTGNAEAKLALERGEINGHGGTASILRENADWFAEKKAKVISQFGLTKYKALPDVPLLIDYVVKPDDKEAMRLFLARQETGKPYFAPPGIPKDRLEILRKAFDGALKDPGFLADVSSQQLDFADPLTGPEVEAFVARMMQTPPTYGKRIDDVFRSWSAKK
jgi:tripartite-type tricarboxylate transporter receptor subunit TctC